MSLDDLLDALLAAVAPFVSEAARTAPDVARGTGMVRIYPDPVHVDVVYGDAGGQRLWRKDGTAELAALLAQFLTAGVDELPEPTRGKVQRVIAAGHMQAIAIVDIEAGTASGVLVGADENSTLDPEWLFMRHRPPVQH